MKTLNKIELKKIYTLASDIVKNCKNEKYQYIYLDPTAARATDEYRLGAYKGYFFEKKIAIPYEVIKVVKSVNPVKVDIDLKENKIELKLIDKNDSEIFTIAFNEPNIILPIFNLIEQQLNDYIDCMEFGVQDLKRALETNAVYSNEYIFDLMDSETKLISVKNDNDKILHTTYIKGVKKTRPFKIVLNPNFILDYLKKCTKSLNVKIEFRNSSCFIHMKEYMDAYRCIIMPIALREVEND